MRDFMEYERIARTLARDAGLKLEFTPEHTVPRTDGRRIIVSRPNPLWDSTEWAIWQDGIYHEIGHNMPENRDIFPLLKSVGIDTTSTFGQMLNLVDDHRVDRTRIDRWAGMKGPNSVACGHHMRAIAHKVPSGDAMPADKQALITLLAFDTLARGIEDSSLRGLEAPFEAKQSDQMKIWYENLTSNYMAEYIGLSTAADELDFLTRIWRDVFGFDDPEQNPEQDEQEQEQGEGGEQGDAEGDKGGKGKGEGEGDEPDTDTGEKAPAVKVNYDDLIRHPHNDESTAVQTKILYPPSSDRHYEPHTASTTVEVQYWKGEPCPEKGYHYCKAESVDAALSTLNIEQIAGKARRLLQAVTRKRTTFNQKAGRLDTSKISRVVSGGSSSERIFKTKTESKALDTAVSILVDYSGSMAYGRISVAIAGALGFHSLLKGLNIKHEILGFTEDDKNYLAIFKPGDVQVSDSSIKTGMLEASQMMQNNCDGDSIHHAAIRLQRIRASRHILVVLSDGSPCGGHGDIYGYTKKVIRKIESEGIIDIVGIGIEDDNVKGLYKHHHVCTRAAELPAAIINVLESLILKGE